MTLKSKLNYSFVALVGLVVLMGAFGLVQLAQVNAVANDIASEQLPSVTSLANIRATANQLRRAEAEHVLSKNEPEIKAADARIASLRAALAKQEEDYKPLVAPGEEAQGFADYQKLRDTFFKSMDAVLALSRAGEDSFSQAREAHLTTSKPTFEAWVAAIGRLVDINNASAAAAAHQASATYSFAKGASWSLMALAVVIGAILSTAIVRNVLGQIGGDPEVAVSLARKVADGDLTTDIQLGASDERSVLAVLRQMQGKLSGVVSSVLENAHGVATASAQIAQGNSDLSSRTEQQASALEETASSMEQLGATVRQNSDNAMQANQLASSASEVAKLGGQSVSEVVATMRDINESSQRIGDIVGVIDGIAFQTNILALNAAVEAARAGEHGKGFAVVAQEVRTLAQRSATAAREIKTLIATSSERVERGTSQVDTAGQKMQEIVTSIQRVTDIMAEISAASLQQSQGVAQVGEAIGQMDRTTQQNAALVEQSAAAAESLRAQSERLVGLVAMFKVR
ncbi:methyl-accepting chemotaxis protein [Roseateles sp. UC29_93]|uniref:methyl-accepting chemotaxis protein n=1 Tax=Roseateles sp. UC29_93 TaxID=3350177 RepID=UPI00366E4004